MNETRDLQRAAVYGSPPMTPNPNPAAPAPKKSGASVVIIIIVVGLVLCCVVGMLAAIAIPNFVRFQARSKQAEVKVNLKSAYTAEMSFFSGENTYSDDIGKVGFSPSPGNRYLYAFSTEGELAPAGGAGEGKSGVLADAAKYPGVDNDALEKGVPAELWAETGVQGKCPDACSITIVGAGNVDTDSTVDVWSISTKDRTINGQRVPAGQPYNHVNDLDE
ncbi:MAG: fimbrial protein [Myxococcaceae bacterium]|nr:fimbrial protein [Myxococcaceae bacterium]